VNESPELGSAQVNELPAPPWPNVPAGAIAPIERGIQPSPWIAGVMPRLMTIPVLSSGRSPLWLRVANWITRGLSTRTPLSVPPASSIW
jgi:hypothetical protein